MAFSFFGKRRDDAPEPENPEVSQLPEPERVSFFDRMKAAVTRTRENLSGSLGTIVALTREVDDVALDDLEFALLASDIGAPTTNEILGRLRDRALRHGIDSGAELKRLLLAEILRILDGVAAVPATPAAPEVIMMVGVNGTGKTTTSGKLAALYRR